MAEDGVVRFFLRVYESRTRMIADFTFDILVILNLYNLISSVAIDC